MQGDTVKINGTTWAFTGNGFNSSVGSFGKFVEHVERPKPSEPRAELGSEIDVVTKAVDSAKGTAQRLRTGLDKVDAIEDLLSVSSPYSASEKLYR